MKYDEKSDEYYLHLFDVTQADLNWDNEKVRQALYEMVNYWIQFGVDGFRFDVINLISKDEFKNSEAIGKEFYTDGPVFTNIYMNSTVILLEIEI